MSLGCRILDGVCRLWCLCVFVSVLSLFLVAALAVDVGRLAGNGRAEHRSKDLAPSWPPRSVRHLFPLRQQHRLMQLFTAASDDEKDGQHCPYCTTQRSRISHPASRLSQVLAPPPFLLPPSPRQTSLAYSRGGASQASLRRADVEATQPSLSLEWQLARSPSLPVVIGGSPHHISHETEAKRGRCRQD